MNLKPPQIISFWSNFYIKRLPPLQLIKQFSLSRPQIHFTLFFIFSIQRLDSGEKYSAGFFFLLCTEMVRTPHQHLHAVDGDDAHAQQADWSQLQQRERERLTLAQWCRPTSQSCWRSRWRETPPHAHTTRPAFFTANGKLSSPVPMFPFRMWIRVWKTLKLRHRHR